MVVKRDWIGPRPWSISGTKSICVHWENVVTSNVVGFDLYISKDHICRHRNPIVE